jgi:hypothetical protein
VQNFAGNNLITTAIGIKKIYSWESLPLKLVIIGLVKIVNGGRVL